MPMIEAPFIEAVIPPGPERRVVVLLGGTRMTLVGSSRGTVIQSFVTPQGSAVVYVRLQGEAGFEVPETGNTLLQVTMGAGPVVYRTSMRVKGGRFALRSAADSSEALMSVAAGVVYAYSRENWRDRLVVNAGEFVRILPRGKPKLTTGEGYPVPPEPTPPAAAAPPPPAPKPPPAPTQESGRLPGERP